MTSAMLLNSQGEQILDSKTVSALIDLRPKSVLVVGSIPDLHRLSSLPESVGVVIASAISKDIARATTVRSNDEIGMRLLIEHLVENGHQKISHISVEAGDVSKSRRNAYESVMKEKGLTKFINIEFAKNATEIDGFDAATRLMNSQNSPTAITAFNDLLAIGAQGATDGTVAITGYDNTFLADLRQISLTSVDPGNTEIANKAAQLLLKNDKDERAKTYLMEPKLIVRSSSKSLAKVR
jgi:DNA-binding LacI/PurR family transcriptional regulator